MPAKNRSDDTRQSLTGRIADELLGAGLAELPLRDLAARLGTSDRMLLYYFGDKSALIQASIGELAIRLDRLLAGRPRRERRLAPADLLQDMAAVMKVPGMSKFRAVWADILARGGRGEAPFDSIADALVKSSLASLRDRLAIEDGDTRARMAAGILAITEGVWLIGMVAPRATEGAMEILIERFRKS